MEMMFKGATLFNQPLRKEWDMKHVTYGRDDMFEDSGVPAGSRCLLM